MLSPKKSKAERRFFFDHVGAKRKAHFASQSCKKKAPIRGFRRLRTATRAPRPRLRRLLKKAGENFHCFVYSLSCKATVTPQDSLKTFTPDIESANIVRLNFDKCAIIPPNGCDSRTLQKIHTSPTTKNFPARPRHSPKANRIFAHEMAGLAGKFGEGQGGLEGRETPTKGVSLRLQGLLPHSSLNITVRSGCS